MAKTPLLGKATDFPFVKVLIHKDYEIIYEIFDECILIVMLWDYHRNPEEKQDVINKRIDI
ncbi:MAG TPA: hypothetical protein PLP27_08075 [Crocinitomicaceae bacterium]|nr:hypothetical protein [Crocinitomicaceae bacterium]